MNEQYKNLMEQQNIGAEATALFYEKLEQPENKRKSFRWKAVLAAACIALMIPLTALAAEYIFGTPKVKLGKLDWHDSPNGYSVRFENLDSYPLDAFPSEMQRLSEDYKIIPCDSWEEAEEVLGIDLLNNTVLSDANKLEMYYSDMGRIHSYIVCNQYNGQLFYVSTEAFYRYKGIQLDVKAKITVDHSDIDEETRQVLLGVEGVVNKPTDVEISYEEYTTKENIPVVILRKDRGTLVDYTAIFAVNDISYEVVAWVNTAEVEGDAEKQILKDVLDGFKLK